MSAHTGVIKQLGSIKTKRILWFVFGGVLLAVGLMMAWVLLLIGAKAIWGPVPQLKTLFGFGLVVSALAGLGLGLKDLLKEPFSLKNFAAWLEQQEPALMNQASALLENEHLPSTQKEESEKRLNAISLPVPKTIRQGLIALGAMSVLWFGPAGLGREGAMSKLFSDSFDQPTRRAVLFADLYEVKPGNSRVMAGEPLVLSIRARDGRGATKTVRLTRQREGLPFVDDIAMEGYQAEFLIESASGGFNYFFEAQGLKSPEYVITVYEPPRITELKGTLVYPKHFNRPSSSLDLNSPEIFAPVGSTLNFAGKADRDLGQSFIQQDGTTSIPLKTAGADFQGRVNLNKDQTLWLTFSTREGEKIPRGRTWKVKVLQDAPPLVVKGSPEDVLEVVESTAIDVYYEAQDDHLVHSVTLQVAQGGNNLAVTSRQHNTGAARGMLKLPVQKFFPKGQSGSIRWRLMAKDSSGQEGHTKWYQIKVLTPKEIQTRLDGLAMETESALEDFEEMQEEVEKSFEAIKGKISEGKQLNQEDKARLDSDFRKQKDALKNMEKLKEKLDQAHDSLENSPKVDPEVLERVEQVQKALNEVLTPEMQQILAAMQEQMKNMTPEKMQQAMNNMLMDQKKLKSALEKTLAQLKTLKQYQLLAQTKQELKELKAQQDQLNKALEKGADPKSLAEKQRQLQDKLAKTEDKLREIGQIAQEQLSLNELRKLPDQVDEAKMSDQAKTGSEKMDKGDKDGAQKDGKELSQKMASFEKQLEGASKRMQEALEKTLQSLVYRLAIDAVSLSQEQESVLKESRNLTGRMDAQKKYLLEKQVGMGEKLQGYNEEMAELVKQSLAAPMEWLGATHQLIESTNQSKSAAENGDTNRSMVLMDQTIQTLNALARELLAKSGEMKKQMGQGSSMDQMLERLGQVSAMQQQLNQQMMKMPGMGSPGMMEMMQQLGDKQGQVQQELDKMMKEFRQFKEMNERLKDVMKEMEQVKKALQNGESGSRIRETQSRIMRRLLQLQTAMKKQDQDNKRKADKPKTFSPTVRPKALPESPLPYTMQELLQRLEREPYPKEYLHEIREYYRLLLDKQKSRQSF